MAPYGHPVAGSRGGSPVIRLLPGTSAVAPEEGVRLVAEHVGDLQQDAGMGFLHFDEGTAAVAVHAVSALGLLGGFRSGRQHDEVGGDHLYVPAERAPGQRDRRRPVEQLKKGVVGDDAVPHVQLTVLRQPAVLPGPVVHFVHGLVQLPDGGGRKRVFDDQVAELIQVFPLRVGHLGVLVSVFHG